MKDLSQNKIIEKYHKDSQVTLNRFIYHQEFFLKHIKNFEPINGREKFNMMRKKISQKIEQEFMFFLEDLKCENLLQKLMFVVYNIINENVKLFTNCVNTNRLYKIYDTS